MNFQQAIVSGFQNYVTFSGRATRPEYWYWILFCILGGIVTGILDYALFDADTVTPLDSIGAASTSLISVTRASGAWHVPARNSAVQVIGSEPASATSILSNDVPSNGAGMIDHFQLPAVGKVTSTR